MNASMFRRLPNQHASASARMPDCRRALPCDRPQRDNYRSMNKCKTCKALIAGITLILAAMALPILAGHLLCPAKNCVPGPFDLAGLMWARQWHSTLLNSLFSGVTWLGSIMVLIPLALVMFWRQRQRPDGFFIPLALVGSMLISWVTKLWVARPRPALEALIPLPADASFPSGHTLQATAFFLAWAMTCRWHPRYAPWLLATAAIVLVGLSRIYLQVHFPTDVLFGAVTAALWVTGLRLLMFPRPHANLWSTH